MNSLAITGMIKRVTHIPSKDPAKPGSALILVQYGRVRESSGNSVEFVNACQVRMSGSKYEALKDTLLASIDHMIEVEGRIQGKLKTLSNKPFWIVEAAAEKVKIGPKLEEITDSGINKFYMTGVISEVTHIPSKDESRPGSAVLLLKYGSKAPSQHSEFVDACMVRIPSYKYDSVKEKLVEGAFMEVDGHLQGVVKVIQNDPLWMIELVSDKVEIRNTVAV